MESSEQFYFALLRISTAQIFRHAGFAGSRPSVMDTATDLTAKYLKKLAETARLLSEACNSPDSELTHVLSTLESVGLLKPLTLYDTDLDDTRAIDAFISWAKSSEVEDLRRIAGVVTVEVDEDLVPDTGNNTKDAGKPVSGNSEGKEKGKSKEAETDIPIKREVFDDQTASLMDLDIPTQLDEIVGTPGLGVPGNRDTEPPVENSEQHAARVKLKQVDWLTALKLKEDAARFKGTVLGEPMDRKFSIEGFRIEPPSVSSA